jgi:hypothetical protein
MNPEQIADYALDWHRVRRALADIYRPEGVEIWLAAANFQFGGEAPGDLIMRGEADRVLAVIEGMGGMVAT